MGDPSSEISIPILYLDESICVIDKPPEVFVHPNPLDRSAPDCINLLGRRLDAFIYTVHRIDRPTSGALVFALNKHAASALSSQFRGGEIEKRYLALVRGHLTDRVRVDRPVPRSKRGERVAATSTVGPVAHAVVDEPVGRYEEGWFSLVEVRLHTGRFHQARRHLRALNHPIIGDTSHGDPAQNRFFRSRVGESRLFLRAYVLKFAHPGTNERMEVTAGLPLWWRTALEAIGLALPPEYSTAARVVCGG